MRKVTGGLTETGRLKAQARDALKNFAVGEYLEAFEVTPKGEYVIAIADVDGKTAYLRVNATISVADNLFDEPKAKASTGKADENLDLSGLFD